MSASNLILNSLILGVSLKLDTWEILKENLQNFKISIA